MTYTDTTVREYDVEAAEAIVEELFKTPEGRRDPHPRYHRLRQLDPVHRSEYLRAWLLTRYDDCRAVLRDPRFEKRFEESLDALSSSWRTRPSTSSIARSMLMADPPHHSRLRKRVARAFTPRRMAALRPTVEDLVADLLDAFEADGGGDLVERIAFRLPVEVIGELLGMPAEDLPAFRAPVLALTHCLEIPTTRDQLDAADEAHRFCARYFADLIATRRRQQTDDLVGVLVSDPADDALDDAELVDMLVLLFVAGFETTTNLIGNGVISFLEQPEQLALLRDQPELAANLAPELLRHDTSVQFVNRVASEDIDVGGVTIPAGDTVFAVLGAANRDPQRYEAPDDLDLTRSDVHPLAFGGGIHHCIGAALASLELEVLFSEMAARYESIDLAGDQPRYRDRLAFRGAPSVELSVRRDGAPVGAPVRPAGGDLEWRRQYRQQLELVPPPAAPDEVATRMRLLAGIDFFAGCTPAELVSLAETAYPLAFEPGEVLVAQGEPSPDAFVIAEGVADVEIDGAVVATVETDHIVGERGVLTQTARAATVTATSHLSAYVLATERLRTIIDTNPVAADVMRRAIARYETV